MNAGVRSLVGLVAAMFVLGTPTALGQESGPSDHEVPVDGRSLHLSCSGTGAPTVLFEAGGPDAAG